MTNRSRIVLLFVLLTFPVVTLISQEKEWGPFDRLLVIQYFLSAAYPDLTHTEGALIFRAVEFHTSTGQGNVVDLVPCHPGSGVLSYNDAEPKRERLPNCGDARHLSKSLDFLSMDIKFGAKYPVREFGASGSFVLARAEQLDKLIAAHSEWDSQQRLEAVHQAAPQFGPDQKAQFLKSVPAEAILKFTGCRLRLDSAEFLTYRLEGEAQVSWGRAEWRLSGRRQQEKPEQEESCTARFEPFDGKLIYVGSF